MKLKGGTIFLLMQAVFVIAGFTLYFGLKEIKESKAVQIEPQSGQAEPYAAGVADSGMDSGAGMEPGAMPGSTGMEYPPGAGLAAPGQDDAGPGGIGRGDEGNVVPLPGTEETPACDFTVWIGKPVDENAIKETGRPYRILPPGSVVTMDYSAARINVHTDDAGIVMDVTCG